MIKMIQNTKHESRARVNLQKKAPHSPTIKCPLGIRRENNRLWMVRSQPRPKNPQKKKKNHHTQDPKKEKPRGRHLKETPLLRRLKNQSLL